jgi:WD40 repeat protein
VTFSPDGKYLASSYCYNTIKLWSVEWHKEVTILNGHSSGILSVAFSPDGKCLASASYDYTVKLWSIESQREVTMLQGHSD